VIWIALAIIVAALIVRHELRRISRGMIAIGTIFERLANRSAERSGDAPVTRPEDGERWSKL
jgi:hypothetical protein